MNDEPLAFFITWTVYGTFLQGDVRGWRKWGQGFQSSQTKLAEWRLERLKYSIELLDINERHRVTEEVSRLSLFRGWKCWAASARCNHVHAVVSAPGYSGAKVRDQLKSNATRVLREFNPKYLDRPIWTELGDWLCINSEDDLAKVISYVLEAQDRKDRGE